MPRTRMTDDERRARNREAVREYVARNPEKRQEYLDRTREQRQEQQREYRRENPELSRAWRERNPERVRVLRQPRDRRNRMRRHGPGIEEWIAATREAQGGKCYLCAEDLIEGQVVIDHDHACCPAAWTCSACRRGLACQRCNRLIGQVGDDPALLHRIADALDAVLGPTRGRIAAKPSQLGLMDGEG